MKVVKDRGPQPEDNTELWACASRLKEKSGMRRQNLATRGLCLAAQGRVGCQLALPASVTASKGLLKHCSKQRRAMIR